MRKLLCLFIPRRMDVLLLLIGILFSLTALHYSLGGELRVAVEWFITELIFASVFAIGAALALRQVNAGRVVLWLTVLVSVCVYFLVSEEDSVLPPELRIYQTFGDVFNLSKFVRFCLALPLVGLVSYLVQLVIRLLVDRFAKKQLKPEKNSQRLTWMIGFAILLYLVHQLIQLRHNDSQTPILILGIVLIFACFYFVTEALTGAWSWLKSSLALISVLMIVSSLYASGMSLIPLGLMCLGNLIALGSGTPRERLSNFSNGLDEPKPDRNGLPLLACSFWGLGLILLFGSTMFLTWYLYLPAMLEPTGSSFWSRVEKAKCLARLARATDSRCVSDAGFASIEFDFAKFSRDDSLTKLDQSINSSLSQVSFAFVTLKNLHPGVQTKLTSIRSVYLSLEGGTISAKQLEDLSNLSKELNMKNVTVNPSGKALVWGPINVEELDDTQISQLLDSIDPNSSVTLQFGEIATPERWQTLSRIGQHSNLLADCTIMRDQVDLSTFPRIEAKNLFVLIFRNKLGEVATAPAFCDNNLKIDFYGELSSAPLPSIREAALLLRGLDIYQTSFEFYSDIQDWNEHSLLVYQRNARGKPSAVLFPVPFLPDELSATGLEELEVLYFGYDWLDADRRLMAGRRLLAGLPPYEKLYFNFPQLKELYFSNSFQTISLKFLVNSPNLTKLQISLVQTPEVEYQYLASLKNLIELTIIDQISEDLFEALSRIKSLKKLVIVVSGEKDQAALDKLVAKFLPNVEVQVVEPQNFKPQAPPALTSHFKKAIEDLKAKYVKPADKK